MTDVRKPLGCDPSRFGGRIEQPIVSRLARQRALWAAPRAST
jgi:hypothetical protein